MILVCWQLYFMAHQPVLSIYSHDIVAALHTHKLLSFSCTQAYLFGHCLLCSWHLQLKNKISRKIFSFTICI